MLCPIHLVRDAHNCGLACCKEAALLAVVVYGANHSVTKTRTDVATGDEARLAQDVNQISICGRTPFADGLDRVRLCQPVEPDEQTNAPASGELGFGLAPTGESYH